MFRTRISSLLLLIASVHPVFGGEYYDDFADEATKDNYDFLDADGASLGPSEWIIEDDMLVQHSNIYGPQVGGTVHGKGTHAVLKDHSFSDFILTANAMTNDDDAIGLVFCRQDFDNYYTFEHDIQNGPRLQLVKFENNVGSFLSTHDTEVLRDTTYNFKVVKSGSSIKAYRDGMEVMSVTDDTFDSGAVGMLSVAADNAYYHDFSVAEDYWYDDFSDAATEDNYNFYDAVGSTSGPSVWTVEDGMLTQHSNINGPRVGGTVFGKGTHAVLKDQSFTDFTLTTITWTNDDDVVGLVFCRQDFDNYYTFEHDIQNGPRLQLVKFENNVGSFLSHVDVEVLQNIRYEFKVVKSGSSITAYRDGMEVMSITDDTFDSGAVGMLSVASDNGSYQDFWVTGTNPSGGGSGDPHFKMWTGEKYDFHGACDLVLLQNPDYGNGLGMDIHIRTKFTKQWSYIATAVLRIGDDSFEVMGGINNHYWINKVEGEDLSHGISGFPITFEQISSLSREFHVDLGHGSNIVFKTFRDFVSVEVDGGNMENFVGSLGMMGNFDSFRGEKIARDGKTVIESNNAFGLEWQVLPSEPMLFHKVEGVQLPEKCLLPDNSVARRHLRESTITMDAAAVACGRVSEDDRDACIFDVMATNDMDMAGAY